VTQYIKNVPLQNLTSIRDVLNNFLEYVDKTYSNNRSKYIDTHNPIFIREHVTRNAGTKLERVHSIDDACNRYLHIVAPKEHFDESIPLIDPDPIALYDLGKTWLYLDAWNLDGYMFKSDINLPEVNN